ncbi:MAG: type II toxin-antitoxin system PemK/MazF family toxin [Candidatus Paceibacterota bacterium]|jgi:mRNA interferase MazF
MQKDFDGWNGKKKKIHTEESARRYHERDIWFCSLGVNVGFEQDGTGLNFDRPVVVVKGFNANTCFAVALTGRKREGTYYKYLGVIEEREASAVLSQVRIIDTKRLIRKIGVLDRKSFEELKKALIKTLF